MVDQISLKELIREDTLFKKFLQRVPRLSVPGNTPPWRLFLQKEPGGPWAKKDYREYPEAYDALRLRLPKYYDGAIHSKREHFPPPRVKLKGQRINIPLPPGHVWCELCRRPVVLQRYWLHPNIPNIPTNPEWLRCQICGMRQVAMNEYQSPLRWPLGV